MLRPALLLVAAAAAVFVPSAAAAGDAPPAEREVSACPAPAVIHEYRPRSFRIQASLEATGCPAREERQFTLSAFISRVDESGGEGHGRAVVCGPFRASDDIDEGRRYSCDVDLAVAHPRVEAAHYQVEVTYPGGDGEETFGFELFCRSDGATVGCEDDSGS